MGRTLIITIVAAALGLTAAVALWHIWGRLGGLSNTSDLPAGTAQPALGASGTLSTSEPPPPAQSSPATAPEGEPLATEAPSFTDFEQNTISAEEVFGRLLAAAEAGSTEAILHVAEFYGQGWGVRQNFSERFHWLQKAAEAGDPQGLFLAALALEQGLGVAADQAAAQAALVKAADAGLAAAHFQLGQDLLAGPKADPALAALHLEEALAGGLSVAANLLGQLYLEGAGNLAPDAVKARQAVQRGADMADPEALKNLGVMFKEGWGGPADPLQALKWYLAAREAGWEGDFWEILAELEALVGAKAARQAEAEARAWVAERSSIE